MWKYMIIGVGGFLGANLRYLVQGWFAILLGSTFPYGTLVANVTGSFLLAFFLALTTQRVGINPAWRLFFAVGLMGGYTTFSSFSYETLSYLEQGFWRLGAANLAANVIFGMSAALLGFWLARLV
jgi:CrcB protein